ncbi:MAG: DUF2330 domain-containing protein [Limisphaerales bacterium]
MRTLLLVLLVAAGFLAPMASRADGKVFPSVAVPESVRIPDQRAILSWSKGVERLVIETRFLGRGSNFAWVVPLPSPPVVEPVSTGLFTTLTQLMQPKVVHAPTHYWLFGVLVTPIVAAGLSGGVRLRDLAIVVAILLMLVSMLLPSLATAKAGVGAGDGLVEILDHQRAGVFESTTLTGRDPAAVRQWLTQNGYEIPPEVEPVIRDYLSEGWVFVASRVHRSLETNGPSALHPLQFTFPTQNPVYPLRLTGVGNGDLEVDLFVFGEERAKADHFDVIESRPTRLTTDRVEMGVSLPDLPLAHEGLISVASGAPWVTRLRGRLTPETLRRDAVLRWSGQKARREVLYSSEGAWKTALNWTVNGFNLLVIGLAFHARVRPGASPFRLKTLVSGAGVLLLATVMIRLILPVVPVRLQRSAWMQYSQARHEQLELQMAAAEAIDTNAPITVEKVRQTIARELPKMFAITRSAKSSTTGYKPQIREEDSPWNYSLRGRSNGVDLILHDAIGGVWETIPLEPESNP